MSRTTINQLGFEAVGIVVALLFVAVVGGVGYKVATMNKSAQNDTATSASTAAPVTIKTKADLTATGKSLDASSAQLDSGLDDSSLDADLNIML